LYYSDTQIAYNQHLVLFKTIVVIQALTT
jgi:hypothetical protein